MTQASSVFHDTTRPWCFSWVFYALVGMFVAIPSPRAQVELDETCTVTILNRTAQVKADGSFAIPNVPVEPGFFRVRITCVKDGVTQVGQSTFLTLNRDGITTVGDLLLGEQDPMPVSLAITGTATTFTSEGETAQLTATATLPDGGTTDVTPAAEGTFWSTSNPRIATVNADGLVTARDRGQAIVQANNEGVLASYDLEVVIPLDADGDGMTDEFERIYGFDPNNPDDGDEDEDGDGLTNAQEAELGTNPLSADTDGDGLADAEELALGTDPLVADTDGDGLNDGEEVGLGTDPLAVDTDGDDIPEDLELRLGLSPTSPDPTTTVRGRIVNEAGDPVEGATAAVFDLLTTMSDASGAFELPGVPAGLGDLNLRAQQILGNRVLEGLVLGQSPVAGGITELGAVTIRLNAGVVAGLVADSQGNAAGDVQVTIGSGGDERTTRTDGDGRYRIDNMTAGSLRVKARDYRTGLRGRGVGVLPLNASATVDVVLRPFGTVRGTVFAQDGETPVGAGARVRLSGSSNQTANTDTLGRYLFEFVPLGSFSVSANDDDGNLGRTSGNIATTSRTVVADVRYLGRGTVRGLVLLGSGQPATAAGVSLRSGSLFGGSQNQSTGDGNSFEFDGVFVGGFDVTAVAAATRLAGQVSGVVERDGQLVDVVITLASAGTFEGTVFQADGLTPVEGALVRLTPTGLTAVTDDQGRYRFDLVPLRGYSFDVTDPATGDRGAASGSLVSQDQVETVDISLQGFGSVLVAVRDGAGAPAPFAQVTLDSTTGFPFRRTGFSDENGGILFEPVLAGPFSLSARDGATGLAGGASGSVAAGGSTKVTVDLQQAGGIAGIVFAPDGVTPTPGFSVRLSGPASRSAGSAPDGGFGFQNLPLGTYSLQVRDGANRVRATAGGLVLSSQGELLTRELIVTGAMSEEGNVIFGGAVIGQVLFEDGAGAVNLQVRVTSNAGGSFYGRTDVNGSYRINQVPVGDFTASVNARVGNDAVSGSAPGTLLGHGDTDTVNILLASVFDPPSLRRFDANNMFYDLTGGGRLNTGTRSIFAAGGGNRGGARLEVVREGESVEFTGDNYGPTEEFGREIVIRQSGLHGLDVTRKVFVPVDGYFARYLELFTNPTDSPITFGARVASHYRFISRVEGGFRFQREPRLIATSSGDAALTLDPQDRWAVIDDDRDGDPFLVNTLPATAQVFDGEGAPVQASTALFEIDFNILVGTSTFEWDVLTVDPGDTVGLLHFVSQQASRSSASASARRLVQLPPEALTGLSETERLSVRNFDVPGDGGSPLPALASLLGQVQGDVFAHDGVSTVRHPRVTFTSTSPFFGRTRFLNGNNAGHFSLRGLLRQNGGSLPVPFEPFILTATDGATGLVSPDTPGAFTVGSEIANRDITFGNSGIVLGDVRRASGEVVTSGSVSLSGGGLFGSLKTSPDNTGMFVFLVVPPGNYGVSAILPIPGGTDLAGSGVANVEAGDTVTVNLILPETGDLGGFVRTGAGDPAVNVPVDLERENFLRSTRTGTGGEYSFLDVPAGRYVVGAREPNTGVLASASVDILADTLTEKDLLLTGLGTLNLAATFASGPPAAGARVLIEELPRGVGFRNAGLTDGEGRSVIRNVPVGGFTVRVVHPGNGLLVGQTVGSVDSPGQVQDLEVVVPEDEPPTIVLTAPSEGQSILEGSTISLGATATDDLGIRRVDFLVDGVVVGSDPFAPYVISFRLPLVEADRSLSIGAVAVDVGPNSTVSLPVNLRVLDDAQAPSISLTQPINGATVREGAVVTLRAVAADNVGVERVEFGANDVVFGTDPAVPYSWAYPVPEDYADGGPRELVLQATAFDPSGLSRQATATLTVVSDEPPTVAINTPTDGVHIIEGAPVTIQVSATDDAGIRVVEFFVDGEPAGGDLTAPFSGSFRLPGGEDGSPVVVEARATDTIGQQTSATVSVIREDDLTPPTVEIVSPADGSIISLGDSDVVIVIDRSSSTGRSSGADVDGDDVPDTILKAEIFAARQLLGLLNPVNTRAGVVSFSNGASLRQQLTGDFDAVNAVLTAILDEGTGGGANFFNPMRVATDELVGPRARRGATAVQLFFSDGAAPFPDTEVAGAAEGGICVNTFAVGSVANPTVLQQMAQGTGCVFTSLVDPDSIAEILPNLILFGINQLPVVAEASDDVGIRRVEFSARSTDDTLDQSFADETEPFSGLFRLPAVTSSLDLTLRATAEDFGDNEVEASPISVTVLPAENAPRILRVEPPLARVGDPVTIFGKFFEPVAGNNVVTLGGVDAEVLSGDKIKLQVRVPVETAGGPVVVTSGGLTSNEAPFGLLRTGIVRVQVDFSDGQPAEGARVELRSSTSGTFQFEGNTDENGVLEIEDVDGSFTVRGQHPGNTELFSDTDGIVAEDGALVEVEVTLPGAATVQGRIQFADGTPAADASVQLSMIGFSLRGATSDGEGRYDFQFVPLGSFFTLNVTHPSGEQGTASGRAQTDGEVLVVDVRLTPALRVLDLALDEGDDGQTDAVFAVELTSATDRIVQVSYFNSNGSARNGTDYLAQTGVLTFDPGETSLEVPIPVLGDLFNEPDETFFLRLNNAIGARIVDSSGTATILNDDPLPAFSIADVEVTEGNVGAVSADFVVTLSAPSLQTVRVNYATADDTATASEDYQPVSGQLIFGSQVVEQTITVPILAETDPESDETFFVNLSNPLNADLPDDQAIGTILDDDSEEHELNSFVFDSIPGPQSPEVPFGIRVTAKDAFDNTVTSFEGPLPLRASDGGRGEGGRILGDVVHTRNSSGNFTLGYAFTPAEDVEITHVRHYFGTKVSIWRDTGELVVSQSVVSTPGAWLETALPSPVVLEGGNRYRVAAYTGSGPFYWRTNLGNTFPAGTIDQGFEVPGDNFPANSDNIRWWFVDLVYRIGEPLPVTPDVLEGFVNGVWSGDVRLGEPGTEITLRVDDGDGHVGESNPFAVELRNDLAVTSVGTPDPAQVGSTLTYTIEVSNIGPDSSTGVTLTDTLPEFVIFQSATSSQGACSHSGGVVSCDLGDLADGASATITIEVVPNGDGLLVNRASASRNEAEAYLANNVAEVETAVPGLETFRIESLLASGSQVADHNSLTGDDRGGIAISPTHVFYTGDNATAVFPLDNLGGGSSLGTRYDALVSDLRSGRVFTLANGNGTAPLQSPGGTATALLELDGATGVLTGDSIGLSEPIVLPSGTGIFAGYGRALFHTGSRVFNVDLPSGLVTDLGAMSMPNHQGTENWAFWGVAEHSEQGVNLVYVRDSQTIARTRVPDGETSVLGSFSNLRDMASITVAPVLNRWYFHYEGSGQFGGGSETIGFADANFLVGTVEATDDLSVAVTALPQPAYLEGQLTYTITVTNSGPSTASSVVLTDELDPNAPLLSLDVSQGTHSTSGATVTWEVGDLVGESSATATIVVGTPELGTVLNVAAATRGEPDFYIPNNTRTTRTSVTLPALTIDDVVLDEGDEGTTDAIFTVTLSSPRSVPVEVEYFTRNGSAFAGVDYGASTGTLVFDPGITELEIHAEVLGDALNELDEEFFVQLFNPVEAFVFDNRGIATITNDDPLPTLSIGDVSLTEGNVGTTLAEFPVTLSAPSGLPVEVDYASGNGTAISPGDFLAVEGALFFSPGQTERTIPVIIVGEVVAESDETFELALFNEQNAELLDGTATGTILDDDGTVGQIHHFAWEPIAGPQFAAEPFSATVRALDAFGDPVTDYAGSLGLFAVDGDGAEGRILGDVAHSNNSSGNHTLGYAFTPSEDIVVTHVRHYYGAKVSIWRDTGELVVSQTVVSTPGTWTETALPSPVVLEGGSRYRVAAYTGNGPYYWRTDLGNTFPLGSIDQSYQGSGDTFPTGTDRVRYWFVDLVYRVGKPLPVTPEVLDGFVNGVWNGDMTVGEIGSAITLEVDDGDGHVGESNPFAVELRNDLALSITDTPDPVEVGSTLTYTIEVSNIGPDSSTGVTLTDTLPEFVIFQSASASQGVCSHSGGVVTCSLGDLADGATATVTIEVVPNGDGLLVSQASVSRNEAEAYLVNNVAEAKTAVPGLDTFRIESLLASGSQVADHNSLTGDDRGGIAISPTHVFYTGDGSTAVFPLDNLGGGSSLGARYDALVSDLRSGRVFTLANGDGTVPLQNPGGTATALLELDGATGVLTGDSIGLSEPIVLPNGTGIFAGYGRALFHTGSRVFNVDLPSGLVTDLGEMSMPAHRGAENWAFWGVAEHDAEGVNLVYVQNNQAIARTRVPDGETSVLGSFSNLRDMASITVAPALNRWYFHHEGGSQFGGSRETIGFADASFLIGTVNAIDDISVAVAPSVTALEPGDDLIYTITVENTGPSTATSVVLTDELDPRVTLNGVTVSQGSSSVSGATVTCELGDLGDGATATITIDVTVNEGGSILNTATVTRGEPDFYLPNNTQTTRVRGFTVPELFISDAEELEGSIFEDDGEEFEDFNFLVFTVSLSAPSSQPVSVDFFTDDLSAFNEEDYFGESFTLEFEPGQTEVEIFIELIADNDPEDDEELLVILENPVNATIAEGEGLGTIVNDDFEGEGGDLTLIESSSAPARLMITLEPVTEAQALGGAVSNHANARLSFATEAGRVYRVECADALDAEEWELVEEVVGDGEVRSVRDLEPMTGHLFYRLIVE